VTRDGNSQIMRRLAAIVSTLFILGSAGVAAGSGSVPPPPQIPRVPGSWSHVDMNVTLRHKPHTLSLDRGRILQVTTTQITLREGAGVNAVVPINAQTLVTVDGARATIGDLRRRMSATTMRIDDGAAVRVRATSF
jgi:hypothetical protein